jgi:hypothetical protein
MKQIILKNSITPLPSANSITLDEDPVGKIFKIKWAQKNKNLESAFND